ncbi:cysteine-rich and transmembrane domain-containing protein B-like [Trifolium pratense]|uniref:cysteine-rich and transmembrane domain-containing protein B-like n=1 Tax=Trifolium pratense TaxID=57577 RepID=UPI001E696047|nr:cysteine-rich and transmembrane domain-containing protein B-like [Trifolium pratense]
MSSHFNNQQQAPVSYPPTGEAYSSAQYVSAPPPMGYPSKDGSEGYPQQRIQDQTTSRGDGFWKGCCAALCCCCALDICF